MATSLRLLERSSDGAFAIDGSQRIVFWNQVAEQLLGFSAAEAMGCYCWQVFAASATEGTFLCSPDCEPMNCLRGHTAYSADTVAVRHSDGHHIALNVSSMVCLESNGEDDPCAIVLFRPLPQPSEQRASSSSLLAIRCLGPFQVHRGESHPISWPRRQAKTLLKFFISHRNIPVHREVLLDALWPEAPLEEGVSRPQSGDPLAAPATSA